MKIICTSDWHLGDLFHGIDRRPEHEHFLNWLKEKCLALLPDLLLVAGDVFDNGDATPKPIQKLYVDYLLCLTEALPEMKIIIIAGNHDNAQALDVNRELWNRHRVEVRTRLDLVKTADDRYDFSRLFIPVSDAQGRPAVVFALPYVKRSSSSYSEMMNRIMEQGMQYARATYPDMPIIMMTHMCVEGCRVAKNREDRSEELMAETDPNAQGDEVVVVGGMDAVSLGKWSTGLHPDYLISGHIHHAQHIWNTDWARYTGSVLPMNFSESENHQGVDLLTIDDDKKVKRERIEYQPQHKLLTLPREGEVTVKQLIKLIKKEFPDMPEGQTEPDENSVYLRVRPKLGEKELQSEAQHKVEDALSRKNVRLVAFYPIDETPEVKTIDEKPVASLKEIKERPVRDAVTEFMKSMGVQLTEELSALIDRAIEQSNNQSEN